MIHHILRIVTLCLIVLAATGTQAVPNLDRVIATQLEEVAARPNDPAVHNDLGNLLVLADRFDEAEHAYRKAKDLSPLDSSARFNLGLLLQQQERFDEASEELSALIEMEPNHAWAHYQLGMIESDLGNRNAALSYYARSFALDPTLTFERNNPHIIDNDLATEALLRSSEYRSSAATSVPRSYGEGARLRELMLQVEEEEMAKELAKQEAMMEKKMAEEEAAELAPPVGSATGSPSLGSRSAEEDEMPLPRRPRRYGSSEEEDPEDSARGSELGSSSGGVAVGQPIGEPVRSAREPSARPAPSRPSGVDEQSRRDAIRERLRGRASGEESPRNQDNRVVGEPEAEVERNSSPSAVPRYNPSRRSTANLRLEILDDKARGAAG